MSLPTMRHLRLIAAAAAIQLFLPQVVRAQQQPDDSLVVLISSKSAQVVDIEGAAYRKVIGPARFFHNNTYLLCDTAFWNVDSRVIDAVGNVKLLQEETVLSGDRLTYIIDENLAQFRGTLVQLTDKDDNTLRTRDLDYNTRDSLATFNNGGAMRDKDGQIIESVTGSYDSKKKLFTFRDDVNMFSDTIFVKTTGLDYNSETSFAVFGRSTDMWNKENMLSADAGWYDRSRETFLFNRDVHIMTGSQEAWCDSIYYYRAVNDVTMLGNVQIIDTVRNVSAVAGRAEYCDSLSSLKMRRNPAVMAKSENSQGVADTVYVAADFIDYWTQMKFAIDPLTLSQAAERLKGLETDAIGTYRRKAAEEAEKAATQAAMENDANYAAKKAADEIRAKRAAGENAQTNTPAAAPAAPSAPAASHGAAPPDGKTLTDSTTVTDSTALTNGKALTDSTAATTGGKMPPGKVAAASRMASPDSTFSKTGPEAVLPVTKADSTAFAAADSTAVTVTDSTGFAAADSTGVQVIDSTKIGFLTAMRNVRLFRKDARIVCDSLLYSDIDSLARLYVEPIIWQEDSRQYAADSIYVVICDNAMERASLMSEAFITIQEDSSHFDQIKSAEMMAFFGTEGELKRFDALGGAQALFFIRENDALATVNKTDSKMLSASFKDGSIQRVHYYETAKSDGYPLVQLNEEEQQLKGFNWQPEKRPADRRAVTEAEYRSPERKIYLGHPRAAFVQTNRYFPGYIDGIYEEIELRDSLRLAREAEAALMKSEPAAEADSSATSDLRVLKDSLLTGSPAATADSLNIDSLRTASDSLNADGLRTASDSLKVADTLMPADSLHTRPDSATVRTDSAKVQTGSGAADPKAVKAAKKKAEKEAKKKAREEKAARKAAEREAKWQAKEAARKAKQEARERRKLEKLRAKKRKALNEEIEEIRRENELFEKYRRKYESQSR